MSLLAMMLLAPSISLFGKWIPVFTGTMSLVPLSLLVIGASALALWQRAPHHAWHMIATAFVIVILMLGSVIAHHALLFLQLVVQIIFLLNVLRIVVSSVFSEGNVSRDVLCGAICIYLLTGVIGGLIFVLIELVAPGSFRIVELGGMAPPMQDSLIHDPGWLLYFSFVTLTTVGYGDVLPNSAAARSLAVLVAVVGQVLLVVQIARLVGMHVAQNSKSHREKDEEALRPSHTQSSKPAGRVGAYRP